jgi:dTDP-4-amino-4,6-dideoxygalactose transaminase
VVALDQLRNVEDNWWKRMKIWNGYGRAFNGFKRAGIFDGKLPPPPGRLFVEKEIIHGLHLYTIMIGNRDRFVTEMSKRGICCGIHYKPVHLHSYYQAKFGWKRGMFPNAEWIGDHTCSLPLGPGMTDDDVVYVLEACEEILKEGNYLL